MFFFFLSGFASFSFLLLHLSVLLFYYILFCAHARACMRFAVCARSHGSAQVRSQGLVAACQVAAVGFPARVPYADPKLAHLARALRADANAALSHSNRRIGSFTDPSALWAALLWAFDVDRAQFRLGATAAFFTSHAQAAAVLRRLSARVQTASAGGSSSDASKELVARLSAAVAAQQKALGAAAAVQLLVAAAHGELAKAQGLGRRAAALDARGAQKQVCSCGWLYTLCLFV
jgi:hypothetical protein